MRYAGWLAVLLALGYVVYDAVSLPAAGDLKGGFRELAFYRNENNTGPVVRVYAVAVKDPSEEEMRQYGDLMPYTKYGTTRVFFFRADGPLPSAVAGEEPYFDRSLEPHCIARYGRDAMGAVTFTSSYGSSR